ncbi:MAG: RimK family alpha-L-glutamate ligase [Allosphingosinicella sp.]|uniref:ATP-grasp domain-containing protein n=1 Tax=Allosphingosinicella sp. TaxID=2823234 RepID=UPI00392B67DB
MTDLAILYEHPSWFRPLFAALDRRGITYTAIDATDLSFDPASAASPAPVILNRIAMSSFLRETEHPIAFAQALLNQWEAVGARVINGVETLSLDASKARQLALLARLGLPAPRSRVVHRVADLVAASEGLRWPLLVKANVGGAGAGIARYDSENELRAAVAAGTVQQSIDSVLLVQELAPARDGEIIRIETIGGRFLYAIAVSGGGAFDLCPADACQAGSPVTMRQVTPEPAWLEAAERIVAAAGIEMGGVELLIDDRDGSPLFYDINALSNFVANPLDVLGWDPHERLVDWLEAQLAKTPLTEAA